MPRPRRSRFTRRKANALPGRPVAKQPCCVVCYNEFTPYPLTCNSWEASMGKVFYKVLNIPSSHTNGNMDMEDEESNDEDEDDSIISLPFCAQCHSKVSVMFSLYNQLLFVQEQFSSVRNDVAFTVVETISKNCRNGPMDFIRQQIFQQWQVAYNDAKARDDLGIGGSSIDQGSESLYGDSNMDSSEVLGNNLKISPKDNSFSAEVANLNKPVPTLLRPIKTENISEDDHAIVDEKDSTLEAPAPNRRSQSPIPAMPKLIPMAKLQAAVVQRNQTVQPQGSRLANQALVRGKLKRPLTKHLAGTYSPDISPLLPLKTSGSARNVGNRTALLQNRGVKKMGTKGSGRTGRLQVNTQRRIGTINKTDKRNAHPEGESSDECEGLTTKDIILKQNNLANAEVELFQCSLCPRQYSSQSRLMRHESLCHPNLKALRCTLCPKGFSSSLTLRRHMQNIHHSAIEGYTMCPLCDRSFIKKHAFEVHLRGHEEQGLTIPKLSPSEMPTGKSTRRSANRKTTIKNSNSKRVTGKPGTATHRGYSFSQGAHRPKNSRPLTLTAKAKAAAKFVSQPQSSMSLSKSNSVEKVIAPNSIKTVQKLNPKSVQKPTLAVALVNNSGRKSVPMPVKRKGTAQNYVKPGPASKRVKSLSALQDDEEEIDEDSDDRGLGVDDSDSDYDP